jgi:serpin B
MDQTPSSEQLPSADQLATVEQRPVDDEPRISERPPGVSELVAQSAKDRTTSPDVAPQDLADLVVGNSAFAFDLYRFLQEEKAGENLFYSPYSISLALAMTYAGAQGATEGQMAAGSDQRCLLQRRLGHTLRRNADREWLISHP